MRVSPNKAGSILGLVLVLGLALAGPASAQVGPPVRLLPPPAQPAAQPPAQPPTGERRVAAGVTAEPLSAPMIDGAGALEPAAHGFPANMWAGTPLATVVALLPKIGSTTSPTLQALAYRLLASAATPPVGDGPSGLLLALRAERLTNALGRPDGGLALLQTMPAAQRNEDIAKVSTDLAFLAGDARTACGIVRARPPNWPDHYWDMSSVGCLALEDQGAQAQLGLDVLREARVKDDGFAALIDRALGTDAKLADTLPAPQPLSLALYAKAGLPLSKKALDSARLPLLRAIASSKDFPADQRLIAAEKAAAYGALPAEALTEAYMATPLDPADHEQPLTRADAAGGAKARAILFNAARDAATPIAKANFLAALLAKSRGDLYPAALRAAEALLLEVPVTEDMKPVAVDFARAFYGLDRPAEARAWLDLAAPEAAATLLPLAHIVGGPGVPAWTGDLIPSAKKDPAAAARRAILLVELLAALGSPADDAQVLPLLDGKQPATVGSALLIDSAASAKRLGGTVLAILAAVGDDGANAPGLTIVQSVAALRALGLNDEARHLAIDAALAVAL